MKYRKKPVVIEAMQCRITKEIPCKFGTHKVSNSMEIAVFMGSPIQHVHFDKKGEYIEIETLKGVMRADIGDYIIKGAKGEFYPCKPDIFEQTYEPVYEKVSVSGELDNQNIQTSPMSEKEETVMTLYIDGCKIYDTVVKVHGDRVRTGVLTGNGGSLISDTAIKDIRDSILKIPVYHGIINKNENKTFSEECYEIKSPLEKVKIALDNVQKRINHVRR